MSVQTVDKTTPRISLRQAATRLVPEPTKARNVYNLRKIGRIINGVAWIALALLPSLFISGCAMTSDAGLGKTSTGNSVQILTSSVPAAIAQAGYYAPFSAQGGTAPYSWSIVAGQLPPGVTLSGSTGVLSGIPTQIGLFPFSVKATDSSPFPVSATQSLLLNVHAAVQPLTITFSAFPGGISQNSYATAATATGGITPYVWSVGAGSLPPGLNLNSSTGAITGTPNVAGQYNLTLQVKDSSATTQIQTASAASSILIVAPLQIMTSSLPTPQIQANYSVALTPSGGMTPIVWSVSAGSLPPGLTLNGSTGVISGTATTAGNYNFTIQAADPPQIPQSAVKSFTLSLATSAAVLQIATTALPSGQVQSLYGATLTASGGTLPYAWSLASGSLPAGLSLNASTGTISGTPTAAGTSPFSVQVKDSASTPQTAAQALSITTASAVAPLQINTTSLAGGQVQVAYNVALSASGGTLPYVWSLASGSLPAGLSLNTSTGAISGTPTAAATSPFSIQVKDSASAQQTATQALSIVTSSAVVPLQINTGSLAAGQVQVAYTTALSATGGTLPYVWSLSSGSLPTGLTLNASTGTISGTPTAAGTSPFSVQVKDSASTPQTAIHALSITTASAANPLQISTTSLVGGQIQVAYNATLVASGGTAPYNWTVTSGTLPTLLVLLSTTGVISGTPSTAGTYGFIVQVSDSAAHSSSTNLSISIAGPPPLTISTTSLPSGMVGTAYSGNVQATGGTQPYTWSITSGQLPAGLSLDPSSGTLSGMPTASGAFPVQVQAIDANSNLTSSDLSLSIAAAPSGQAPLMYTSRIDTNAAPETIPALCSPAPCTMTSSDLNPNVVYTRIADASTVAANAGWEVNGEAMQREWNADTSGFYLLSTINGGTTVFFNFNPASPTTPTPVHCTFSGSSCSNGALNSLGIFANANQAFSTVSPYVVYGIGSSGTVISKMDYSATVSNPSKAPTVTTVANLASCPGIPGISTTSEFSMSDGDTRFVIPTDGGGQNAWTVIYMYDTTQGCRWLDLAHMVTGGNWGPTGNATFYDELGAAVCSGLGCSNTSGSTIPIDNGVNLLCSLIHNSPTDYSGRWAGIETECNNGNPSNLNPHWDAFWDMATNNVYYLGNSGGGVGPYFGGGHQGGGFNNIFLNDETDYAGHCFTYRTLPPTATLSFLFTAPACGNLDGHFSWANQTSGSLQPFIFGAYGNSPTSPPTIAWQDEVLGMTPTVGGPVYRFAHAYTRDHDGFYSLIFARGSRDGKWAIFCSDWGGSNRDDVFLIALK
jgi:hypothetical protein